MFCVVCQAESNFLVKRVDEEVKKLVLLEFTVRLLRFVGYKFSKRTSQLQAL
jgi:hypothetical protein